MKPMLCEMATREEAQKLCDFGGWIVEQKLDGVRGTIMNGRLFDRRGIDVTIRFPEFTGLEKLKDIIIDGELICQSNEFGDIQSRMHMRDKFLVGLSVKKNPALFIAFDVLLEGEHDTRPLIQRKEILRDLVDNGKLPSWIQVVRWHDDFRKMWQHVEIQGWEGLVLKDIGSLYEQRRSKAWRKVKAFEEGTAIFTKYEENPRGITLETGDGKRVAINGSQAQIVKQKLIREGKVECHIQFMRSTLQGSDAWRFPSFRGLVE